MLAIKIFFTDSFIGDIAAGPAGHQDLGAHFFLPFKQKHLSPPWAAWMAVIKPAAPAPTIITS